MDPYTSGLIGPSEMDGSTYNEFGNGVGGVVAVGMAVEVGITVTVGLGVDAGCCEHEVVPNTAMINMKIMRRMNFFLCVDLCRILPSFDSNINPRPVIRGRDFI